ncbi:MAG: sigma-70 family RNA polymerase sigma factor [Gemmatimonadaceae bacterium]
MNDADVERLFRTHHVHLVRYLTRRLGDRDWAEEVAQETFVRALRQPALSNERAWLFTVANNLVRDEARRDARRRRHLTLLQSEAREEERNAEPEPTSLECAQDAQERAREAASARRAVDSLAERDRLALLMREEGLDYHEIAAALDLSVGSIGTTLSRARRRLVEAYESLTREGGDGTESGHAAS